MEILKKGQRANNYGSDYLYPAVKYCVPVDLPPEEPECTPVRGTFCVPVHL